MSFRISDSERDQLLDSLGRRDGSAEHLIDDVERALADAGRALALAADGSPPAALRTQWSLTGDLAARLRSALYELPERARELLTFAVLTQAELPPLLRAAEDCGRSIDALAPLLERIEGACGQARADEHGVSEHALREVLHAFRNRTNIKPNLSPNGAFLRFLAMLLQLYGQRFPEFSRLARALDADGLEQLLAS
jgi:hypothetical protein